MTVTEKTKKESTGMRIPQIKTRLWRKNLINQIYLRSNADMCSKEQQKINQAAKFPQK